MSTYYKTSKPIAAQELFGDRLQKHGVAEQVVRSARADTKCLTDEINGYIWVHIDDDGLVRSFTRYLPCGNPRHVLAAIEDEFRVKIYSEYQPQYWGFDTQEEWDAFQKEMSRRHDNEFYRDICHFIKGEPCKIKRGSNGMIMAKIAKKLVKGEPTLIARKRKDELLQRVRDIFLKNPAFAYKG